VSVDTICLAERERGGGEREMNVAKSPTVIQTLHYSYNGKPTCTQSTV
jgi:hypothetical protein